MYGHMLQHFIQSGYVHPVNLAKTVAAQIKRSQNSVGNVSTEQPRGKTRIEREHELADNRTHKVGEITKKVQERRPTPCPLFDGLGMEVCTLVVVDAHDSHLN